MSDEMYERLETLREMVVKTCNQLPCLDELNPEESSEDAWIVEVEEELANLIYLLR